MEQPVRVLQVVTNMNRGGLESMLMNYYRNIDRTKLQFDFLVHRNFRCDYDDEIESLGGRIYRLSPLNPISYKYLKELDKFFKQHSEYKIVHSHLDCMSSIPLKIAKKYNVPIRIAHSHNANQDKNFKYLIKMFYKKKIYRYSTKLFACSEDAGKWMFGKQEFQVFPNAIDVNKYVFDSNKRKSIRNQFGFKDEIIVGNVGRFNLQKNHIFIIDIFNNIVKKVPDAKLMLVGSGSLENDIKNKIKSLNLQENVIFTGVRSDVNDLLQAMDVFLFPSLYEGLPVTLIEAQASGLPCLISDKVPIECKKTDLVEQMSLKDKSELWADKVIKMSHTKRTNRYNEIVEASYDIVDNAKKLTEFYLSFNKIHN